MGGIDQDDASLSPALRFPLFLDLTRKKVIVVGGGKIAARRILVLLDFVRQITVIAPQLRPELEQLGSEGCISIRRREFMPGDLTDADLVITATDDPKVDELVWQHCRDMHIPVNVAGDQTKSDFFFPGIARRGSLVAGVTAGGTDHKKAKAVTEMIRDLFDQLPE